MIRLVSTRNMSRLALLLRVAPACLLVTRLAAAPPLNIAAASDLPTVLPTIAQQFEAKTGVTTRVTFGSSGNFFSQLQNGAPLDVFLSADLEYPRRLVERGAAVPDTLYEYGAGRLVLWAGKDAGLDHAPGLQVV